MKKSSKIFWLTCVLILFLLGMVLSYPYARGVWRWWKGKQAEQLIEQAKELLEEGEKARPYQISLKAYKLAPVHPPVLRFLGKYFMTAPTNALYFWEALGKTGKMAFEDRVSYYLTLVALNKMQKARGELDLLIEERPISVKTLRARALWHHYRGEMDLYKEFMGKAFSKMPGNKNNLLHQADQLIESEDKNSQEEGWFLLWKLSQDKGINGVKALERAANKLDASLERKKAFAPLFKKHPMSNVWMELQGLEWEMDSSGGEKEAKEVALREVERWKKRNLEKCKIFVDWLLDKKLNEVVHFFTEKVYEENKNKASVLRMDYWIARQQWGEAEQYLELYKVHIAQDYRDYYSAVIGKALGWETENQIKNFLKSALNKGRLRRNRDLMIEVAEYAKEQKYFFIAIEASEEALKLGWAERDFYKNINIIARQSKDARIALPAFKAASRMYEENDNFKKVLSYLRLISGSEIEEAYRDVGELLLRNDASHETKILKAFAHYCFFEYTDALSLIKEVSDAELYDTFKLLKYIVLGAISEPKKAMPLIEENAFVTGNLLLDQEKFFIEQIKEKKQ